MAKSMAKIENNIVINLEWCSDDAPETNELKSYTGYSIAIGDTFNDGKFYRNGEEILSDAEIFWEQIIKLKDENIKLVSALGEIVEATYEEDAKIMEDIE